jgi:hypothetical protein
MIDPVRRLHLLSEYPLLKSLARQHTKATRLDGRAIAAIYKAHHERCLMRALGIEFGVDDSAASESSAP